MTVTVGIDSGSTATKGILLADGVIQHRFLCPTPFRPADAIVEAWETLRAGLSERPFLTLTGYGRQLVDFADKQVTEISCHGLGARLLAPQTRTVIDIGGQDSKVIVMDQDGRVLNFVMNDKCAAGTGRFLDMMARAMEMTLDEMSLKGLTYKEDINISSTCTVFAESEVVSLIAENKATDDIVHGLDKSVASRTASLAARVGGTAPFMMTGGVSRNKGLVKALEEKLGARLVISEKAQLCGALGAALYAREMRN